VGYVLVDGNANWLRRVVVLVSFIDDENIICIRIINGQAK
jgi:hypothetical protein